MSKKPLHEIRFGLIKASIWENQGKNGLHFTVGLFRLYRDGDRWIESQRFHRDDLLLVAKVADQAHSWIAEQQQAQAIG